MPGNEEKIQVHALGSFDQLLWKLHGKEPVCMCQYPLTSILRLAVTIEGLITIDGHYSVTSTLQSIVGNG